MATADVTNAWVTELHVRMDCNGCVHKVRKAVHGLDGVYEARVDFGSQMVTVVGRASPEQIVRAIRKGAKKAAAVHSHTGPPAADQPPAEEAPPAAAAPEPEAAAAAPPPAEEASPPPPAEAPPPAENPNPEPPQQQQPGGGGEEDKPMVHTYPYHELNSGHYWHGYDYALRDATDSLPYYVASPVHSYNTYRPPPSQPQFFVVEHGFNPLPAQLPDQRHFGGAFYHDDYQYQRSQRGDRMGAMFSDENPNACRIC